MTANVRHTFVDLRHLLAPSNAPDTEQPVEFLSGHLTNRHFDADLIGCLSASDGTEVMRRMLEDQMRTVAIDALHLMSARVSRQSHTFGRRMLTLTALFRTWCYMCMTPQDYHDYVVDRSPTSLFNRLRRVMDVPESLHGMFE